MVHLVPYLHVSAHVRWFTPDGPYWDPEWNRIWSWPVLLAVLAIAGAVGALALGQRVLGDPLWPRPPMFQRLEPAAPAILGVQAAIALIYAATQLDLFVPNIELPENLLGGAIAAVAIIAGFTFITGVLTRVGALIIIGLFGLAFGYAAWYEALEQVIFVGIALYLVAVGRGVVRFEDGEEEDRTDLSDRLLPYALPLLRWCAGISIIILGFTEKLLAPDLGVAFLQEYPSFNVPRGAGLGVVDGPEVRLRGGDHGGDGRGGAAVRLPAPGGDPDALDPVQPGDPVPAADRADRSPADPGDDVRPARPRHGGDSASLRPEHQEPPPWATGQRPAAAGDGPGPCADPPEGTGSGW